MTLFEFFRNREVRIPNPQALDSNRVDVYVVGGAIRDILMGLEPQDLDFVVVNATAEDMEMAGLKQVGASFPVFLNEYGEEFALARTERKDGDGYHGFLVNTDKVTIEEDLGRRDFTINSIAFEVESWELVDPFGGAEDIRNKVLRHTSDSAFKDDPVRALRLARFAGRFPDFTIAPETIQAVKSIRQEDWAALPYERITLEFEKAWGQCKDFSRFLDVLDECGVLDNILPIVAQMKRTPERLDMHPEGNTWAHTKLVIEAVRKIVSPDKADSVDLFWAAFVHDFGKTLTERLLERTDGKHPGHEDEGMPLVEGFCNQLRLTAKQKRFCLFFTRNHMRLHKFGECKPGKVEKVLREARVDQDPTMFINAAICSMADHFGRAIEVNDVPLAFVKATALVDAFNSIKAADIIATAERNEKKLDGPAIGAAVRQERIRAIKRVIKGASE